MSIKFSYAVFVSEEFVILPQITVRSLYFNFCTEISGRLRLNLKCSLVFFYMNIVVCHKEYWKMIRNIRFYNSCFKFGCGNKVDENTVKPRKETPTREEAHAVLNLFFTLSIKPFPFPQKRSISVRKTPYLSSKNKKS